MNRLIALAAAAAALVLVTAGCGVGSTGEGQVAEATGDYLTALANGDYAAACAELAPEAKPTGDCAAGVEASVADIPAQEIADDNEGKLTLDVTGDTATVVLESGTTLELSRMDGDWLVTTPYGR